jgi:hypothetical protein
MQAMAPGINPVRRLTTSSSAVGKQSLRAQQEQKPRQAAIFYLFFICHLPRRIIRR